MNTRNHLQRLDKSEYRGQAVVHWIMTTRERKVGWLNGRFFYRFRELLTHSQFRHGIACPIFCLMPEHLHLIWMGILEQSDQKLAMRHLRTRLNDSLKRIGFELQDQAYEHVLSNDERKEEVFKATCEYIARNPERKELVSTDEYAKYPYSGCVVPGYPELRPFEQDFWTRFDRTISCLRKNGLIHP